MAMGCPGNPPIRKRSVSQKAHNKIGNDLLQLCPHVSLSFNLDSFCEIFTKKSVFFRNSSLTNTSVNCNFPNVNDYI